MNIVPPPRTRCTPVRTGDVVIVVLPWSEVCIHLTLADKAVPVRVLPSDMVQLLTPHHTPLSFPVTTGEAGLLRSGGFLYANVVAHADYPHEPGYLYECHACEAQCHCTPGTARCVAPSHRPRVSMVKAPAA